MTATPATSPPAAPVAARVPLSRAAVTEAALRYVDDHGLAALSMRKLAAELGVEAMSLYRHVDDKGDLLDGIVEKLWSEIAPAAPAGDDWNDSLRAFGHVLREALHRHPHAAPLMTSRPVMPPAALEAFHAQLQLLHAVGFDQTRAAEALRAVFGYAVGWALIELSTFGADRDGDRWDEESEPQRIRRVSQALPADVADHLFDVALVVCARCDPHDQFEFGLDALLRGVASTTP